MNNSPKSDSSGSKSSGSKSSDSSFSKKDVSEMSYNFDALIESYKTSDDCHSMYSECKEIINQTRPRSSNRVKKKIVGFFNKLF